MNSALALFSSQGRHSQAEDSPGLLWHPQEAMEEGISMPVWGRWSTSRPNSGELLLLLWVAELNLFSLQQNKRPQVNCSLDPWAFSIPKVCSMCFQQCLELFIGFLLELMASQPWESPSSSRARGRKLNSYLLFVPRFCPRWAPVWAEPRGGAHGIFPSWTCPHLLSHISSSFLRGVKLAGNPTQRLEREIKSKCYPTATQTAGVMQVTRATFWRVASSACHFTWLDTNCSDKEAGVHLLFKSYTRSLALFTVKQLNGNRREITRLLYFNWAHCQLHNQRTGVETIPDLALPRIHH